jgi:drug/metabolite transporter (DMT)-like permease
MNPIPSKIWLVILLGVLSTIQNHLAKAFERQGIEALDHVRNKVTRTGEKLKGVRTKSLIYILGLVLNQTVFIYHLFTTPLGGTTAVYTSMYGVGLLVLLLYSVKVMKEPLSRDELIGALAILLGTLIIGVEGLQRPPLNMAWMDFSQTLAAVLMLCVLCAIVIYISLRNGSKHTIGLGFGFSAGAIGALDPLLKGIGQTHGGGDAFGPQSMAGWIVFIGSFLVGILSFLIDQWGFYLRVRANVLVPTFNASYIAVPVILQAMLLPGYSIYFSTFLGLGFLILGFVKLSNFSSG